MVNGKVLRDAVISGANNILNQKNHVDELNVFPVPDGDTGTNMSMTTTAAAKALALLDNPSVGEVADATASAMLRGARGNSGVILSLLFRGFAQVLKGKDTVDGKNIAAAFNSGIKSAYKAVMKPTEGTILTVAREAAEAGNKTAKSTNSAAAVFEDICNQAKITLDKTPDMLPVLKKAGVVDAGGKGLVIILEGMLSVIKDGKMVKSKSTKPKSKTSSPRNAAAEFEGEIAFTYCTEFIINKTGKNKGSVALRAYLETLGDSVVVVDDDDIIKVHVHTDTPGNAIQEAIKYGPLTNIKIDNMKYQHENKAAGARQAKINDQYLPVDPDMQYGFVAVSAGNGLDAVFNDLGVNCIVHGGQTMNPSTDDILNAILSVPAKTVFVLPNNKNIIMAAEQAVALADREVCVLQTRNIPQGLSAMLAFDPDETFSQNRINMTKAIDKVSSGQITFAARDSDFEGHKIKKGEILALANGKLSFVEKDLSKSVYKLVKTIISRSTEFVTVIYGADVTDQAAENIYKLLRSKLSDNIEINLINGGQPVYYYIVSSE